MERLESGYLLALIALATVPAAGQQTAPHDANTGSVAVIGDIARCDTYPVPTGTTLTVRQAVINAGLVCESVNVAVIRATQDRPQWTQSVSATSGDNGEPVESGDVLVVQAMSPLTSAVRKNAALRSDSGILVVGLEQDGIVIGDVLQATSALPPADGQLQVIYRFPGQAPIAKAELYHPVVHGDVISISRSNRTVLKGFGNMSPTVSEWKSGSGRVARDPFIPKTMPSSDGSLTSSELMFESLRLPTAVEPGAVVLMQDEEPTAENALEPENDGEIPTGPVSALSISQAEDVSDAAAADSTMSFASESMTVAPVAPPETQIEAITNPTSTAFNPWNLVFMGGLLLAGTLILAGTLKPEPDESVGFDNTASRTTTVNASQVASTSALHRKLTEVPRSQSGTMPVPQTAETQKDFDSGMRTNSGPPVAKALVAGHEWFSGDWHGQFVASKLPLHGHLSTGESALASSGTDHNHDAIQASDATILAEAQTKAKILSTRACEQVVISDIALSARHAEAASELEASQTLSGGEQSFLDLEDLLQNRLPIDLCETQLPLRVTLFGKPAGPGRLRIDAAHAAMPAPHINLPGDKRREKPVAATDPAAAHTAATHVPSDVESPGSLDRALHFLQERTES